MTISIMLVVPSAELLGTTRQNAILSKTLKDGAAVNAM
jgi:hypothetical protein